MARSQPRGKPPALARWVASLACEDEDEILLLNAGMTRQVIARWDAVQVSRDVAAWGETVDALCQQDCDARGGVCSYDVELRRVDQVRATYLVRRISDGAKASDNPASMEGLLGMLMKHLEQRDKQNQQMLETMASMTKSTVSTLIQRLEVLEAAHKDVLVREREAMELTTTAIADAEWKEKITDKVMQYGDAFMMKLQADNAKPPPPKPNGSGK